MNYFRLLIPHHPQKTEEQKESTFFLLPSELKGLGDESNEEILSAQGNTTKKVISRHGTKPDLHNSFPKGLPKAFSLREKD